MLTRQGVNANLPWFKCSFTLWVLLGVVLKYEGLSESVHTQFTSRECSLQTSGDTENHNSWMPSIQY